MGLAISRFAGESFWVDDDWFQVVEVAADGCVIADRRGKVFRVDAEGFSALTPETSVREGLNRQTAEAARLSFEAPKSVVIQRSEVRLRPMALTPADTDVALLAPVPYVHLVNGLDTLRDSGKVAFGSSDFERLYDLARGLNGRTCPVLIYASHDGPSPSPTATWVGRLDGVVESRGGRHREGMTHRPSSTASEGSWAVFWELDDLQQVGTREGYRIGDLSGWESGKPFMKTFIPQGPMLIKNPLA